MRIKKQARILLRWLENIKKTKIKRGKGKRETVPASTCVIEDVKRLTGYTTLNDNMRQSLFLIPIFLQHISAKKPLSVCVFFSYYFDKLYCNV